MSMELDEVLWSPFNTYSAGMKTTQTYEKETSLLLCILTIVIHWLHQMNKEAADPVIHHSQALLKTDMSE